MRESHRKLVVEWRENVYYHLALDHLVYDVVREHIYALAKPEELVGDFAGYFHPDHHLHDSGGVHDYCTSRSHHCGGDVCASGFIANVFNGMDGIYAVHAQEARGFYWRSAKKCFGTF